MSPTPFRYSVPSRSRGSAPSTRSGSKPCSRCRLSKPRANEGAAAGVAAVGVVKGGSSWINLSQPRAQRGSKCISCCASSTSPFPGPARRAKETAMTLAMIEPQAGSPAAAEPALSPDLLVKMHDLMLKARLLERQMIAMLRSGHAYFWIGGPGEEAFSVPLGLLVHKGQGPAYDYLHLHYRSSGTILAMGADPIDPLRQMNCA